MIRASVQHLETTVTAMISYGDRKTMTNAMHQACWLRRGMVKRIRGTPTCLANQEWSASRNYAE